MLPRALDRLPVLASRLSVPHGIGMAPKRRAKSAQAAAQEPPAQQHVEEEQVQQPAAKRQRGTRGKAAKAPPAAAAAAAAPPAAAAGSQQFFLMKSEPDVFSIDDLAARPNQTEPWDGVRSHQAKNVLKSMRCGDLALFYHSNAKPPGVVGVVEVVREAYPDPSQFDKASQYFDASSKPDVPKWVCVDVRLRRQLARQLSLEELKGHSQGRLAGMALFKYGRLSVQPVTPAEWEFLLGLEKAAPPGQE